MWRLGCILVLCATLGVTGCSRGPRLHPVSGTVTLDGTAIPEGDITFVPANPALGPRQGKIKDGRFDFLAAEGKNRVEISASKILPGGARGAGGEPVAEEYIPERYNTSSILSEEVRSSRNHFDFKLESKKK